MGLFGSIDSWARPRHSRAGVFATLLLALAAYPLLTAGANGPSLDGPAKAVASVPTAKLERKGDEIIIERGDGKKIRYSVMENKLETLMEANTSGMKRLMTPYDSTKEGLGLITCAGNWVPRDKVFDKRILIRAVAQQAETADNANTSKN